jgi:hypothetical protein
MEQGIARLWHAREEARVDIASTIEEEGYGGAEGPRKADFERCMRMVIRKEAGAARDEDRWF